MEAVHPWSIKQDLVWILLSSVTNFLSVQSWAKELILQSTSFLTHNIIEYTLSESCDNSGGYTANSP